MQHALKLAARGKGKVEPNPAVGAVIVKANQIIGRGWHKKYGGPHAEINALEDCKTLGADPKGSTMYVTLEPCCHKGKTPACTQAIISAGLSRVFVAVIDPSEHSNGKGVEQLRKAGIEVEIGLCQQQAEILNAPFMKYARTGLCWVILKWAQSIDGKLSRAEAGKEKRWISNDKSRKDVQNLRRRVDGILVGIETVLADDPLLTARPSKEKTLTRIVLDSRLRIPPDSQLIATAGQAPLLIATTASAVQNNPLLAEAISQAGGRLLVVPAGQTGLDLRFLTNELSRMGLTRLLVEGGAKTIVSFLKAGLADEIYVYIAPLLLGGKGRAEINRQMEQLAESAKLQSVEIESFGGDVRITGLLKN